MRVSPRVHQHRLVGCCRQRCRVDGECMVGQTGSTQRGRHSAEPAQGLAALAPARCPGELSRTVPAAAVAAHQAALVHGATPMAAAQLPHPGPGTQPNPDLQVLPLTARITMRPREREREREKETR